MGGADLDRHTDLASASCAQSNSHLQSGTGPQRHMYGLGPRDNGLLHVTIPCGDLAYSQPYSF